MKSENAKEESAVPDNKENKAASSYTQLLVYMCAITGRIDEQCRKLAEELDDDGQIHVIFGAADGLSLSYSIFKLIFDGIYTNTTVNSQDVLHDWLLSPTGMLVSSFEMIGIIGFSMMANYFKDDDPNAVKRYIAVLWPYLRDILKALKNAFKGLRNLLQTIQAFLPPGHNLAYLLLPLTLGLGLIAVTNRLLNRYMLALRKDMMRANTKLLAEINDRESLSEVEALLLREKIQRQSLHIRGLGLLSATYSGMIDSVYLYLGILSLCVVSWPAFVALVGLSSIYCAAYVVARLYEEYDFQRKLLITQAKIELSLYHKTYKDELFNKLKGFEQDELQFVANVPPCNSLATSAELETSQAAYKQALEERKQKYVDALNPLLTGFRLRRDNLKSLMMLSSPAAFVAGLRNGLAAYGAVVSLTMAVSTFLALASVAFPPAALISVVSIGIGLLVVFAAHSVYAHYTHRIKQTEQDNFQQFLTQIKEVENQTSLKCDEELLATIEKSIQLDPSPQFFFMEWSEVIRSTGSAMSKGVKATETLLGIMQKKDSHDHYQDTPEMGIFIGITTLVHILIFSLRALTKQFRPPIDKPQKPVETNVPKPTENPKKMEAKPKPDPDTPWSCPRSGGSGEMIERTPGSPKHSLHFFSRSSSVQDFNLNGEPVQSFLKSSLLHFKQKTKLNPPKPSSNTKMLPNNF